MSAAKKFMFFWKTGVRWGAFSE